MPFFKSKPEPITYLFSSDNFRQTTITNPQTNETYWIEKYHASPTAPSYLLKPSSENGSASRTLIATIELETQGPEAQHITYNGERKRISSMFPLKRWQDPWTRIMPTPLGNYEWSKKLKLLDPSGRQVGRYEICYPWFKNSPTGTLKLTAGASNLDIEIVILAWMAMKYDQEEWGHMLARMKTHPM